MTVALCLARLRQHILENPNRLQDFKPCNLLESSFCFCWVSTYIVGPFSHLYSWASLRTAPGETWKSILKTLRQKEGGGEGADKALKECSPEWMCAADVGMAHQGPHSHGGGKTFLRSTCRFCYYGQKRSTITFLFLNIHGLNNCSPTETALSWISWTYVLDPVIWHKFWFLVFLPPCLSISNNSASVFG